MFPSLFDNVRAIADECRDMKHKGDIHDDWTAVCCRLDIVSLIVFNCVNAACFAYYTL